MRTYQDLVLAGESDIAKAEFCRSAINEFRSSEEYKEAADGEAYYAKHNLTIERFQKWLYTVTGRRVEDIFSANHKLKTTFFRRLTTQQVQYILGNGVTFQNEDTKAKLGDDFDIKIQSAAKKAMAAGRAFLFWNLDHVEVFGFADTPISPGFCPLYDEETAKLRAGIRYWFRRIGNKTILRSTLYEADGYTSYSQVGGEAPQVLEPKRGYIRTVVKTDAAGIEDMIDDNYSDLPIIPMYANDLMQTELFGVRENIDCYDLIKSGLMNNIDDSNEIYWTLQNTGGMDDVNLAQFIQRMKTVRAAVVDGDDNTRVEAHTINVPVEARKAALEILRRDIYEDFQALDVTTLSAAAKTTQEIQAAYQAQDNKCADFEYYVLDAVKNLLTIAGIDDEPTLHWNKIINQSEQVTMLLQAAQYLTEDAIIKLLPFLTPEQADEIIGQKDAEGIEQFNNADTQEPDADSNEPDEDSNEPADDNIPGDDTGDE